METTVTWRILRSMCRLRTRVTFVVMALAMILFLGARITVLKKGRGPLMFNDAVSAIIEKSYIGAVNDSAIVGIHDRPCKALGDSLNHLRQCVPLDECVQRELQRLLEESKTEPIRPLCKRLLSQTDFYKPLQHVVNPFPYSYDFLPSNGSFCDEKTFIVVLVHSFHTHLHRREAIRATWGSIASGGTWPHRGVLPAVIKVFFLLGRHSNPELNDLVAKENAIYNDMIQASFMDSYKNLTLKSILTLKVAADFCSEVTYLLKSDDDMFINLPYLINILRIQNLGRAILGPYNARSQVLRRGRWKAYRDQYPFDYYPPYESGAAYLITGDLVADLYATSQRVPILPIEDVYITGILAKIVGARHEKQSGFAYYMDRPLKVCEVILNQKVTATNMPPKKLKAMWRILNSTASCPRNRSA